MEARSALLGDKDGHSTSIHASSGWLGLRWGSASVSGSYSKSVSMGGTTSTPAFSLEGSRYNQSSYFGRVRHFYSITDPRTLFVSDEELGEAQRLLNTFKENGTTKSVSDEQLWEAKRIVESVVHPNNGEPISTPFRFSAFAPMNIAIVTTMILPSTIQSVPRTIFIHWANQSYNSAVNFANRNTSNDVSRRMLGEAYCAAVGSSVSIALGATFLTKRVSAASPRWGVIVGSTLPFLAVLSAGIANLCLIRRNEWQEGVAVADENGDSHGKSIVAGKQGLAKCSVARFLWNFPIMVVPPLILARLAAGPLKGAPKLARLGTEVAVVTAFLFAGVPPALAAFPQTDTIDASKLEPEFHQLVDRDGRPIEKFYFNKGL